MPSALTRMLDRLVLREFLPLFGVGILTFAVLISSFTVLKEAIDYANRGVPLTVILEFFFLGMMQIVSLTLPMAVLFGALMSFGRLSSTGEITALRAGGVNFFRVAAPVLVAGFLIGNVAFLLNERIAPQMTLRGQEMIRKAATELGLLLSSRRAVYYTEDRETGRGWVLAAASSLGNRLQDVSIQEFDSQGNRVFYVALSAEWGEQFWTLTEVDVLHWNPRANPQVAPISSHSDSLRVDLNKTPGEILRYSRNPEELSLAELRALMRERDTELALDREALGAQERDPAADPDVVESLRADLTRFERQQREFEAKYHLKIAAPFACVIFVLIAAPLGMNPLRATSSVGFGLSLILVFVYYMLSFLAVSLAEEGVLAPSILAWIPNLVFTITGVYLNGQFVWGSGK